MPLNSVTLTNEILKISGQGLPIHEGFPKNAIETGRRWGQAIKVFFDEIVVPQLIPGTTQTAADAFASAMTAALGPPGSPTGTAALQAGFLAFGPVIALGTLPPNVSTPPPSPPVLPPLPPTPDPVTPAVAVANAVFAWSKTGLTGVPPQPPSIPWS